MGEHGCLHPDTRPLRVPTLRRSPGPSLLSRVGDRISLPARRAVLTIDPAPAARTPHREVPRSTHMRKVTLTALACVLGLSLCLVQAADPDPYDQSGVPLEKQPTDPKATKVVLVAGRASHGPG